MKIMIEAMDGTMNIIDKQLFYGFEYIKKESGEMELILLSQNERKNIKITLNKDVTSFNIISSGSYGLAKEPIVLLQTNLDSSLEIK